jgi:hypothetical protein
MLLKTKPDFSDATRIWDAYWEMEIIKRPPVVAEVAKPRRDNKQEIKVNEKEFVSEVGASAHLKVADLERRYRNAIEKNYDYQMKQIDIWLDSTEFVAESIPYFGPDLGPDQFAAFLGAPLRYSESSPETNWSVPIIDDWRDFLPITFDWKGELWSSILEYSAKLAQHGDGRYLVSVCDLHSNMDALLGLRGSERLCVDFHDHPEELKEAMQNVRRFYKTVYNALYAAGGMGGERGSIGWAPFWCSKKFAVIQCDFLALISPSLSRKYVIPALEEEASFLDHCVYHLDGPSCLPHLEDILSIKKIDVIQWVPGAGKPPLYEWIDLLKRCQSAGKGLQITDVSSLEVAKSISRELRPEGLVYCLGGVGRDEAYQIVEWLERNT